VRYVFSIMVLVIVSISVGSVVFALTDMHYKASESQGPYSYNVNFGEDNQAKDLGVVVNLNLSRFAKSWFVGEEKNVILEVSAEKSLNIVQNFSWRIFWVELFTFRDGSWHKVAHGASFLNESEWSDSRLYKRQDVSVSIVNLNYLELVNKAWFRIGIMMDMYYDNKEYSLTSYTSMGEIGPVTILSPLFSPISLAAIATTTIALPTTLAYLLLGKITSVSKKIPSLTNKR